MDPYDLWPAVVAWRGGREMGYSFLCAGALLSDRVLVTEAGCFRGLLQNGEDEILVNQLGTT